MQVLLQYTSCLFPAVQLSQQVKRSTLALDLCCRHRWGSLAPASFGARRAVLQMCACALICPLTYIE